MLILCRNGSEKAMSMHSCLAAPLQVDEVWFHIKSWYLYLSLMTCYKMSHYRHQGSYAMAGACSHSISLGGSKKKMNAQTHNCLTACIT